MRPRVRSRGFALLLVLWTLVPVSALFLTLTGTARSDGQLTFNLRDAVRLQAAADGGIDSAVFALLRSSGRLPALRLSIGGARVTVMVTPLGGLLNPNLVQPELLASVLEQLGAEPARAASVASAILDWRTPGKTARPGGAKAAEYRSAGLDYGPPGAPFESIDEVRQVLGMTPALFAALRPSLTLYTNEPAEAALATGVVRAALLRQGIAPARGAGFGDTFRIDAVAEIRGARVERQAVVRLGPTAGSRPWRMLAWTTGAEPP